MMRVVILMALAVLAPLRALSRAVPATDTQWWQELDFAGTMAEHWSYLIAGFTRFSDVDPDPALTGAGGFVTWTHGAVGCTLGLLHARLRLPASGVVLNADLPVAAVTGTFKTGPLTWSDRLRIEELIGVPGEPWRYRNLVSIAHDFGPGPVKAWAVSDEIFVDVASERLTRNRLLAGPMLAVADRVDVALDYLNERDVDGRPGRIEGVFVDIGVRL